MADNLNTPKAIAEIWNLIGNKNISIKQKAKTIKATNEVLGLNFGYNKQITPPKEIEDLANQREKLRKQKNWPKSDKLREEINQKGWNVEDHEDGYSILPIHKQTN